VHSAPWSRLGRSPLPVLLMLLSLLLTGGCAEVKYNSPPAPPALPDLVAVSYGSADNLDQTLATYGIKDLPMLVASFVNRDDLEQTSPLGRTLSEQIGSRLAQHGYPIADVRLRADTLLVRGVRGPRPVEEQDLLGQAAASAGPAMAPETSTIPPSRRGEFALSRQLDTLNREYGAHSILTGTYAVIQRTVYVGVRVLRCTDGVVLAADDFSLPYQPGLLNPVASSAGLQTSPPPPIVPSVRTIF
jgi:TolB-like protein